MWIFFRWRRKQSQLIPTCHRSIQIKLLHSEKLLTTIFIVVVSSVKTSTIRIWKSYYSNTQWQSWKEIIWYNSFNRFNSKSVYRIRRHRHCFRYLCIFLLMSLISRVLLGYVQSKPGTVVLYDCEVENCSAVLFAVGCDGTYLIQTNRSEDITCGMSCWGVYIYFRIWNKVSSFCDFL